METIYIPQLAKSLEQTDHVQVKEYFPALETLTPVQGSLQVTHRGNYLEVSAHVETIVTLTCDRCLQQYNHRLSIDPVELIWLEEPDEDEDELLVEREVPLEDLVETISPQGYFKPDEWLYEQLCLEIPQRQICDAACAGIQIDPQNVEPPTDRRWASLEALRKQISN
ncbi:DUF177 domain-containing protein [Leptolyngbya sp. FACHB-671]|uniref:YceD family protein n=1 Tax=Leptolyngbya sp. FACHB-671 TaxID=2692812 RepID=UPI0016854066|nr:YceD family protein [Leptolyngbya sp. FACHB-671]MBD2066991.1 DUF177 domain-containing protein [Leptolyngbya sp. FACHB-671]